MERVTYLDSDCGILVVQWVLTDKCYIFWILTLSLGTAVYRDSRLVFIDIESCFRGNFFEVAAKFPVQVAPRSLMLTASNLAQCLPSAAVNIPVQSHAFQDTAPSAAVCLSIPYDGAWPINV